MTRTHRAAADDVTKRHPDASGYYFQRTYRTLTGTLLTADIQGGPRAFLVDRPGSEQGYS